MMTLFLLFFIGRGQAVKTEEEGMEESDSWLAPLQFFFFHIYMSFLLPIYITMNSCSKYQNKKESCYWVLSTGT